MSGTDETQAMGGADQTMAGGDPPAQGGGGGHDDDDGDGRKWWPIPLAILLAGLVIGGGIAIAGGGGDDKKEATDDTTTSTTLAPPTSKAPPTSNGTQPPSDDPKIDSLSTGEPGTVTCTKDYPPPMFDSPTDPYEFTVSWSTTNATQTVLSVDGPGPYGTFGPAGSASFSYGCLGSQTHTYLVTAKGPNGPDVQKQVSITINQGP